VILFTQSTVVLHKYLNDELKKLFCLLRFSLRLHRIPRLFRVWRNPQVFQVCGHPARVTGALSEAGPSLGLRPTSAANLPAAAAAANRWDRRTDAQALYRPCFAYCASIPNKAAARFTKYLTIYHKTILRLS